MHHGASSLLSAVTKHLSFLLDYSVVAANFSLDCGGFHGKIGKGVIGGR